MNNRWNKLIYKLWAPVYDLFFNSVPFFQARKKVFASVTLPESARILVVGVGTGSDLEFLPESGCEVLAIDISEDMLEQAKNKWSKRQNIIFQQMDAQQLKFPDSSFDVVIANLVLSVVPDPKRCMNEIVRVTRQHGSVYIFDKFAEPDKQLSLGKRILRPLISILGTDIGRKLNEIIEGEDVEVVEDTSILFGEMYRNITLVVNKHT